MQMRDNSTERNRIQWFGYNWQYLFGAQMAALVWLLIACGVATPADAVQPVHTQLRGELQRPLVVVVLGSSSAEGVGPGSRDSSWAGRLARYLRVQYGAVDFHNLARSNYTTFHILAEWDKWAQKVPAVDPERNIVKALSLRPDIILIHLPTNDNARGIAVQTQVRNLQRVVALAQAQGVRVWVASSQPLSGRPRLRKSQRALADSILRVFGPYALDFWTPLATPQATLKAEFAASDGIHLNARGHAQLFEVLRREVDFRPVGRP